jgi:hypothetical protein
MLSGMTEAAYRVTPEGTGYKVEINRPGELIQTAVGFASEAAAQAWIEKDKRLAGLDDRQEPVDPPKLREI